MILYETARDRFMLEYGQLLIPFASLKLTDDNMEKIFVNTVRKLQNKRPNRAVMTANVDPTGITIPDAIQVLALKYKIYDNFDRVSAPISRSYWFFDPATRILRSLFASIFIIVYLQEYKIGYFQQKDNVMTTVDGESQVDFFLKASYKKGTLILSKTHYGTGIVTTCTEVSRSGNIATLAGTLGNGTLDLTTLKVSLNITDQVTGDIIASYYNARKAIQGLDEHNMPFYLWFTVDMLRSWANLKAQASMNENTGMPFNLQADLLLDRARVLEDQLNEHLNANNSWYNWGF
jgi:hypothetical protein